MAGKAKATKARGKAKPAPKHRKASPAVPVRWVWRIEARDLFSRPLFVVQGLFDSEADATVEVARIVGSEDMGSIRLFVVRRDATDPTRARIRRLDNSRPVGRTSGAKGARKVARVATSGTSRPSRKVASAYED